MALKAVIDSLDEVDEALRDFYAQPDGASHWILDVEPVERIDGKNKSHYELRDTAGLRAALGVERNRADKAEAKLRDFGDLSASDAQEALAKLEELSALDPEKEAEQRALTKFEQMKKQLEDSFKKTKTSLEDEIASLYGQLEESMLETEIVKALNEEGGSITLLKPQLKAQTKLDRDSGGKFVRVVLDEHGNPEYTSAGGTAVPMTILEKVKQMKQNPEFAPAFKGTLRSGGGSTSTETTRASASPATKAASGSVANDPELIGQNLEAIDKGEMSVEGFD